MIFSCTNNKSGNGTLTCSTDSSGIKKSSRQSQIIEETLVELGFCLPEGQTVLQ